MTQGRPTAAPAYFPYNHDSMAVVMAEEARQRKRELRAQIQWINARTRHERERRSVAR